MGLAYQHSKMHECILSVVATDTLVLKHQAISIHSAARPYTGCRVFIVFGQFYTKSIALLFTSLDNKITVWKKNDLVILGLIHASH